MSHIALDTPSRVSNSARASPSAPPAGPDHRRGRFNPRVVVLLTAVAVPFAGFVYLFLAPMINGGIVDHGDHADVNLKALGSFRFDALSGTTEDVPSRWRGLDGRRVVLEGYMVPVSETGKARHFQFVYNVQLCCFGGRPQVQERVFAQSRVPLTLYDSRSQLVRLTGKLHVRVVRNSAGAVQSVFDLDVERADPIT